MDRFTAELKHIHRELETAVADSEAPEVKDTLDSLEESARRVGLAWSGSWVGYHAHVYYAGLKPPPTGVYFDKEWGINSRYSRNSGWELFDPAYVYKKINEGVDQKRRNLIAETLETCNRLFDSHRHNVVSIMQAYDQDKGDPFLNSLVSQIEEISAIPRNQDLQPPQTMTRDSVAMQQGFWTPPHIDNLILVDAIRRCITRTKKLLKIVERAMAHINRINPTPSESRNNAGRIFIGHGQSRDWLQLEKFLQERLNLKVDEFNRVPIGGMSTKERLEQMLDSSCFAFLLLTAEDEVADVDSSEECGDIRMQARMNVVHEAGLFQGRLGFERAIILLENGCEEFSNIHGLGQIRFEKGMIDAKFEEIRRHLEKSEIIDK